MLQRGSIPCKKFFPLGKRFFFFFFFFFLFFSYWSPKSPTKGLVNTSIFVRIFEIANNCLKQLLAKIVYCVLRDGKGVFSVEGDKSSEGGALRSPRRDGLSHETKGKSFSGLLGWKVIFPPLQCWMRKWAFPVQKRNTKTRKFELQFFWS